jgi:TPR repeat protein
MPKLSRFALAFLAFPVAAIVAAAQALPGDLEALRAKAESGNGIAQYNLGLAYAEGRGVPQDEAEAYVWLSLASDHGGIGRDLDSLLARMSSEDLAEGKRRLAAARMRLGLPAPTASVAAARPTPAPTSPKARSWRTMLTSRRQTPRS